MKAESNLKQKLIILLTIFSLSAYSGCKSLQDALSDFAPDVSLVSANLTGLDFSGADIAFTYKLKNKINFGLTFTRLKFDIKIDGNNLFNADNKKNIKIAAKGTTTFVITHRIVYTEFAQSLIDLYKKDSVKVNMSGLIGILGPLEKSIEVPINAEKVVDLPKLPKISFGRLKYKSANLNPFKPSAKFELDFKVINPNKFNLDLSKLDYKFVAAGSNLVSGQRKDVKVNGKSETNLKIPVVIKGLEVIKLVPKLRDLNSQSFNLSGNMNLKVAKQVLKFPFSVK